MIVCLGWFLYIFFFWCCKICGFPKFYFRSLLLVYRNALDLWVLILDTAMLLNLIIKYRRLLVNFLKTSMKSIMSPENTDNLTFFFPTFIAFISIIWLIVLFMFLGITLNNSGDNEYSFTVSDFREEVCNIWLFSRMFPVGLS